MFPLTSVDGRAGANSGIGLETAVDLASRGGRIIMACRSLQRGKVALEQVQQRANSDNVVLMKLGTRAT